MGFKEKIAPQGNVHTVECSACRAKFAAPFQPSAGRELLCPRCIFQFTDLSGILYFVTLKDFLKKKFGGKITVVWSRPNPRYNVLFEAKGKEAEVICTVELGPKFNDILPRHPMKNPKDIRVPPFSDMNAKIKARDEKVLALLQEFAKTFKFDGIDSKFA